MCEMKAASSCLRHQHRDKEFPSFFLSPSQRRSEGECVSVFGNGLQKKIGLERMCQFSNADSHVSFEHTFESQKKGRLGEKVQCWQAK